jgi:transposase
MQTVTTIGLDITKSVFQVHGVDATGQVVVRRQLKRRQLARLTAALPHDVFVVALEADQFQVGRSPNPSASR